jgi:predicted small metal-binding protein
MTPQALQRYAVTCGDVHPVRCNVMLRASNGGTLTDRVRAHGASAHGFTPVWYTRERIIAISGACAKRILW